MLSDALWHMPHHGTWHRVPQECSGDGLVWRAAMQSCTLLVLQYQYSHVERGEEIHSFQLILGSQQEIGLCCLQVSIGIELY